MHHGDYMSFAINWEKNEMHLEKIGPVIERFCENLDKNPVPITPIIHVLERYARACPQKEPPFRYLLDMMYDGKSVFLKMHCSENYASVVDVPRERLQALLGNLLTPRETEITTLLFEGHTIRYIASALHIAEGTVKRIIHNIYQKLRVGSQVELVREIYARLAQSYATA